MWNRVLDLAYRGEVFFSRLQGIAAGNPRHNGEFRLVRTLAPHIRAAVDAGSNIGDWTAYLLSVKPDARVACIEPDPSNARVIRQRFQGTLNVRLFEAAVSASVGTAVFTIGDGAHSGTGYLGGADGQQTLRVPTLTLDSLSQEYGDADFDLIKADVEGEEVSALLGAQRLFRNRKVGSLQLEYNSTWLRSGRRLKELFEFAHDHAYTVLAATPFGFTSYPAYGDGLEDFRMRNLVLARKDHLTLLRPIAASGRARIEALRRH